MDPNYDAALRQKTEEAGQGAGARTSESFRLPGLDTLEAQALYLAHAAVDSAGLREMTATADPPEVGVFVGRGPPQVTWQQGCVQALVYLDEQAARLGGSHEADAQRLRDVSAAVMRGAGGVHAAAEMPGRRPRFGGTDPEDRWESGGDNVAAKIAEWQTKAAGGEAGAAEQLRY